MVVVVLVVMVSFWLFCFSVISMTPFRRKISGEVMCMTVTVWLTDWLNLRRSELKPRTIESYEDLFRRFVFPSIGEENIELLSPLAVRHLLAEIMADGKSRTAELLYVVLNCAFRELDRNPLSKIKKPKHTQVSPDPWSDEHRNVYLAACQTHRHGLALSLALLLGLRRGEVCGLRWKDVDFATQVINIVNQRVRLATGEIIDCSPKSASSVRSIPLSPQIIAMLKKARGLPDAYLCSLSPSGLDNAHRTLVKNLGLPVIPLHGLRHSMATSCIRNGGEMRALQDVLGHSNYATTANRYTHPDREMLSSAIDAADKLCYTVLQQNRPVST